MKQNIINEGNTVDRQLFHFTRLNGLFSILSSNTLRLKYDADYSDNEEIFSMCFTRVSYAKTGYSEGFTLPNKPGCSRIVFNKDRLKTVPHTKFVPVNFWFNPKSDDKTPKQYATIKGCTTAVENEERLLCKNPQIKNANAYIDRIDIYVNDKTLKQFDLYSYFQIYATSIFYPKIYVYFDLDNFNYANTDYAMTLTQAIKNLKNHSEYVGRVNEVVKNDLEMKQNFDYIDNMDKEEMLERLTNNLTLIKEKKNNFFNKFKQALNESLLAQAEEYHFTTLDSATLIMRLNVLKLTKSDSDDNHMNMNIYPYYLCMTRTKNLDLGYSQTFKGFIAVRFTLDGDKLNQLKDCKVVQFSFFKNPKKGMSSKQLHQKQGQDYIENEDRLISKNEIINDANSLISKVDLYINPRVFHDDVTNRYSMERIKRFINLVKESSFYPKTYIYNDKNSFNYQMENNSMSINEFETLIAQSKSYIDSQSNLSALNKRQSTHFTMEIISKLRNVGKQSYILNAEVPIEISYFTNNQYVVPTTFGYMDKIEIEIAYCPTVYFNGSGLSGIDMDKLTPDTLQQIYTELSKQI